MHPISCRSQPPKPKKSVDPVTGSALFVVQRTFQGALSFLEGGAFGVSDTFRRFKDTLLRHGIADDWYAYRQRAFEEIAVAWLEENGVAYVRA